MEGRSSGGNDGSISQRDESELERLDRNLSEMLQELRVALPGVQVLFAFLLTVPFAQGFTKLSDFERDSYFAVLVLTAISTVLLIAPSAFHRIMFRAGRKREIVAYSNRVVILGLGFLGLAMTAAVTLIAHVVFGQLAAIITGALALGLVGTMWWVVPIAVRRSNHRADASAASGPATPSARTSPSARA
jgi:O-antigen/teichoic acid export membrane protein